MRRPLIICLLALVALPCAAEAAPISTETWIDAQITEYYPVSASGFDGKLVMAPGLTQPQPIDWLYSSRGVAMEGDGVTLQGERYHIESSGSTWVNAQGFATTSSAGGWSSGHPEWLSGGYWMSEAGNLTYPLASGGWSAGAAGAQTKLPPAVFAPGPSRDLQPNRSVAVDPDLIPLGSRVYIPQYADEPNGGWFVAEDTGGAIHGAHIDVYRLPPADGESAHSIDQTRILVLPSTEPWTPTLMPTYEPALTAPASKTSSASGPLTAPALSCPDVQFSSWPS